MSTLRKSVVGVDGTPQGRDVLVLLRAAED